MHVANYWIEDIFTRSAVFNGRYSWVDSTNTFAIWYDGEIGKTFDWIFGYFYNLGRSGGAAFSLMKSDLETTCPHEVPNWTNDNYATVTCVAETTTPPTRPGVECLKYGF